MLRCFANRRRHYRISSRDTYLGLSMQSFFARLFHSFTDQAGTWFVGAVLSLLGIFSARLLEKIKFALNRADLRAKYYEEMALDVSHFVFIVDRLLKVYYGSRWASDEDKSAIATEYNETMNGICRKEYVYLSWLQHYWNRKKADDFASVMRKIREVDAALLLLNEAGNQKIKLTALESTFRNLQESARILLIPSD